MVPCQSAAEEVSFEWPHHRIWSTDLKVRTTLHVSINNSGVKGSTRENKKLKDSGCCSK